MKMDWKAESKAIYWRRNLLDSSVKSLMMKMCQRDSAVKVELLGRCFRPYNNHSNFISVLWAKETIRFWFVHCSRRGSGGYCTTRKKSKRWTLCGPSSGRIPLWKHLPASLKIKSPMLKLPRKILRYKLQPCHLAKWRRKRRSCFLPQPSLWRIPLKRRMVLFLAKEL